MLGILRTEKKALTLRHKTQTQLRTWPKAPGQVSYLTVSFPHYDPTDVRAMLKNQLTIPANLNGIPTNQEVFYFQTWHDQHIASGRINPPSHPVPEASKLCWNP